MAASHAVCEPDSGDVAWMLFATTFVMLQTPATGLAQAGLVRRKNALSVIAQAFVGVLVGSFLWFVVGFSLTFGASHGGLIGSLDHAFFSGVGMDCLPLAPSIPGALFASFQMMFALMVPVLVTGAWAEKLPLSACLIFFVAFPLLIYYPLAHWIWNPDGWLASLGVKDFAGGLTIHTSAGISGLVVSVCVEKRRRVPGVSDAHNLPLTILGTSLVWAGWYSFNGGSALAADSHAASALLNTQIAACTSGFTWVVLEFARSRKVPLTSMASGVLSGLAAVTPGSGFMSCQMSFIVGILGGAASYGVSALLQDRNLDDALDVTALQAAPGVVGSIFVGLAAQPMFFPQGEGPSGLLFGGGLHLLLVQTLGAAVCIGWSAAWTWVIMQLVARSIGINISPEIEQSGLDIAELGEYAYDMMDEHFQSELLRDPQALASQLCAACASGRAAVVARLLRAGADPATKDYDKRTPLHLAAAEGHVDVVTLLLDACGTQTELLALGCAADRWFQTPLLDAMSAGHSAVCSLLTERGCGLGSVESELLTEKVCASAFSDEGLPLLTRLLDASASPSLADYDKRTPLHIAVSEENLAAARLLLKRGAPTAVRDRWGHTPKDEATTAEMLSLFEPEPSARASSTSYGTFDINSASGMTKSKRTGSLLEVSLLQNKKGESSEAVAPPSPASPRRLSRTAVSTATAELCAAAAAADLPELRRLLRKRADPALTDYDGRTPLHLAASEGSVPAMEILLDACPSLNINAVDRWHHTPLADALDHGHAEAAAWLQERGGAAWNRRSAAAMCWAASRGDTARVQALVREGRDTNVADYDGRTALMLAASEGWEHAVQWLLAAGADPHLKDRHGHTALDDALRAGAARPAGAFVKVAAMLRAATAGAM